MKALTVCTIHGCPEIATHRGRCADHKRPPRPGRGSTYKWRQTRKIILDRDGYRCTNIQGGNRCPNTDELEVHHIIPVATGGDDRHENLVSLCADCHKASHRNH